MRFNLSFSIYFFASAILLVSCNTSINKKEGKIVRLLDPENLDRSISPRENFFLFANGNWLKKNPIPDNESRWGSLNILEENNYEVQHELLEHAAINAISSTDSAIQKVGNFYYSGMDTQSIEKIGLQPLKEIILRIEQIKNNQDVLTEILKEQCEGHNTVFNMLVLPDDKNVSKPICKFYQGGLGLPEPEYYNIQDSQNIKILAAYKNYMNRLFMFMGESKNKTVEKCLNVIALETLLAKSSMETVGKQAVYNLYNKYSISSANFHTDNLNWNNIFQQLKIEAQDSFIIAQPAYYRALSNQLQKASIETWKAYLKFHLVNSMCPYLNKDFANAHHEFYNKTIRGQQKQQERWKFVLSVVNSNIGELLGQMYVDRTFKPETKKRIQKLVNNIQITYKERILKLDWMTENTKTKAVEKLNAITKKIGYPEITKNYSMLKVVRNSFAQNVMAAAAFQYNSTISKLSKPIDKNEWNLTATTVNACYNLPFNEIVFPAGLLQYSSNFKMTDDVSRYEITFQQKQQSNAEDNPYKIIIPSGTLAYPYFIENADDAVNYGSIGAIIAHEMSHGFDNRGRYYDAKGNLNNWWTIEDERKFNAKAKVLVDQFNEYTVLDTVHVNGNLTLGENIADLGGLSIAYEAFKKTRQGQGNEMIDGFTPDQRFFLSWAQLWRVASRKEETMIRIKTDHHAPYIWRCNGTLSNLPEFYKAFGIKKGDKMYRPPNKRAKIW